MKQLVVNADDFGYARDVNAGIIEAYQHGILTATTLMANADAFDDAVKLAHRNPNLDVGCHLVLVEGKSLVSGQLLPKTVPALIESIALRRVNIYEELRPQIQKILDAGVHPVHFDTHKHTHLLPPVLKAVARLAEEFRVRWIRRPLDFPLSGAGQVPLFVRLVSRAMQGVRGHFERTLARGGCRSTDHFAGFQMTGRFHAAELGSLLARLPDGITEFMCHPGRCTAELQGLPTRLKQSRVEELEALLNPTNREILEQHGVRLTGYRGLLLDDTIEMR